MRLAQREKLVIGGGVAFVFLYALVVLLVQPRLEERRALERAIAREKNNLVELQILAQDYQALRARQDMALAKFRRRRPGFRLFSFLQSLAAQAGITQYISYMKPSVTPIPDSRYKKSTVELKLSDITMEQLLDYLYRVETSPKQVRVRRIHINEGGKSARTINVVLQVATLET